jgi:hypothetical protein
MKTVSVTLDDAEFAALEKLAAAEWGTVDALLRHHARNLAFGPGETEAERRAQARRELDAYVRSMKTGLTVGEKPTRERTYSDRRFHRH